MPDPDERALRDETLALLRELLRIDTSNPPGNETPAAELLRDYLEDSGVACELVARDPARANLVARIPGHGNGPSLALLGHTDVVPADPAGWRHPPFAGHVDEDGYVWGRGAVDMKNETATRAVAMASSLARASAPAATSCSSPRPTRRTASTRSGSPGSCATAPTSRPTTCSTRARPSA
jgi:acetylornithine deacetylase/succinyl-diaminopimelate desuccinylase-like protein